MDDYIKTIINGLKALASATANRLERSIARVDSLLDSKVGTINPVFEGSFSQNRKAGTEVGIRSHAEGGNTIASGENSHAEGSDTIASGIDSHAEGGNTIASYTCSHAEGDHTIASGIRSHAEGNHTIASGGDSHVQGMYNVEDTEGKYAHIVGNGPNRTERSNAHTLDWNGVGWFAGGLKVGGTGQDDEDAEEVALKKDVADAILAKIGKTAIVKSSDGGQQLVVTNMTFSEATQCFNLGIPLNVVVITTSSDGIVFMQHANTISIVADNSEINITTASTGEGYYSWSETGFALVVPVDDPPEAPPPSIES